MDPLQALIGPFISGGLSLAGGLMNTSSLQAINAANIQNQMWSAQGGYLPGLVGNAQKAGLNPLAVLGSRGPNMAVQVGEQPGAGLQQAAQAFKGLDLEMRENQLQLSREELMQRAAQTKQVNIDNAVKQEMWDRLRANPNLIPPGWGEPAAETSVWGAGIKGGQQVIDAVKNTPFFQDFDLWRRRAAGSLGIPY